MRFLSYRNPVSLDKFIHFLVRLMITRGFCNSDVLGMRGEFSESAV